MGAGIGLQYRISTGFWQVEANKMKKLDLIIQLILDNTVQF